MRRSPAAISHDRSRRTHSAAPGSGFKPSWRTNFRYSASLASPTSRTWPDEACAGSQRGTIASFRKPKVARNWSRVMEMPCAAIVSRQESQCFSSESTNVPSKSHRTAPVMPTLFSHAPQKPCRSARNPSVTSKPTGKPLPAGRGSAPGSGSESAFWCDCNQRSACGRITGVRLASPSSRGIL